MNYLTLAEVVFGVLEDCELKSASASSVLVGKVREHVGPEFIDLHHSSFDLWTITSATAILNLH